MQRKKEATGGIAGLRLAPSRRAPTTLRGVDGCRRLAGCPTVWPPWWEPFRG